jgi:hypothetical protein
MRILITIAMAMFFVSCAHKHKATDKATTKSTVEAVKKDAKSAGKSTTVAAASTESKATCSKDKETRTLEVVTAGQGCELQYTKGGDTQKPATSVKGVTYCHTVFEKIKGNLEKAGYKCE